MAGQTVFDAGDPITSRLKLGVTPDGTTIADILVYRPDGTLLTGVAESGPVGDEYTAQWYATQTGLAGGEALPGDWVAVWTVNGTGAGVQPKVYNVRALPSPSSTRPTWTPYLSEVADYVPRLTIDVTTPGSAVEYGTFNGNTNPTDGQAQRILDGAVNSIDGRVGTITTALAGLARVVASQRAAAAILRAYPRSTSPTADLQAADALDRRADLDLTVLIAGAADSSGSVGDANAQLPAWTFPSPPAWGDLNL